MDDQQSILEKTKDLPPQERAAALAHWIYVTTGQKDAEWTVRVPRDWDDLPADARAFNLASVTTWAESADVLRAWVDAVTATQRGA